MAVRISREARDGVCAVAQRLAHLDKLVQGLLWLLLQQCLGLLKEGIVVQEISIVEVGKARVGGGEGAVNQDVVGIVCNVGFQRCLDLADHIPDLGGIFKAGLEQHLVHQIPGRGKVLVNGDKIDAQLGMAFIAVFTREHGDAHFAPVQVAGHLCRKVGVVTPQGVQLAHEVGIELEPVNVLLGQPGGVQQQERLAHAGHLGADAQLTHAVLAGCVRDVIDAPFHRQAVHRDRLQLGHILRGVIGFLLAHFCGLGDDGVKLLVCHGSLARGQVLGQGGVLLLLQAGDRLGNGQGGDRAVREELGNQLLIFALLGKGHVIGGIVNILAIGIDVSGRCPHVGDAGQQLRADVGVFGGQQQRQAGRGSHGLNGLLVKTLFLHMRQGLVDHILKQRRLVGIHAGSHEDHGSVGRGVVIIYRGAGLRQLLFHLLLEHGGLLVQQRGQQVHYLLILVRGARAQEAVVDNRAVGGVGGGLHREIIGGLHSL